MHAAMEKNISFWAKKTGVLPVNLFHRQDKNLPKYAMLDGDINNFCLDYSAGQIDDSSTYKNIAWSSNMRNYIRVSGDDVLLYSVCKEKFERIPRRIVLENMEKFYQYISPKQDMPAPDGIVPFIMREFRGIRNKFREEDDAKCSMTALMYILASLNEDVNSVNLSSFGLPADTLDIVKNLSVDVSIEHLREGVGGLVPYTSLLLRHASGQLFEEANYIAKFNPQLELFAKYDIKSAYDPQKIGAFYTPTYLARSVVEKVIKEACVEEKDEVCILDPACGSGEFLVEALRQLKTLDFAGRVKVYGWDISEIATNMAKFVLYFERKEWGERLELNVVTQDSVLSDWPMVDIVLMNPPYSSWEQLNDDQRDAVRPFVSRGRPNLSGVFYMKAVSALKENGVVGCVMPTSFLINDSTKELRKKTKEKATPFYIGRLGNFVFQRAFVDVCVVMAKAGNRKDSVVSMLWTENKENVVAEALRKLRMIDYGSTAPLNMDSVSIYQKSAEDVLESDVWMPLSYQEAEMKKSLDSMLSCGAMECVKDVFDVRQGCRTGNNSLFKLSKKDFLAMPDTEKKYFRPAVDSDSLQDNILKDETYVFFPYDENGLIITTEDVLRAEVPTFYNKIVASKEQLASRAGDLKHWWVLTRPRTWLFTKETRLVSTEFGNSSNFAIDSSAQFVVERGLAWIPKDANMTSDKLYAYLAVVSSEYFNVLLAIYSKQLAGGNWFNLEKKFVDMIPMPKFAVDDELTLNILSGYGKKIAEGVGFDYRKYDRLVRSLYGC